MMLGASLGTNPRLLLYVFLSCGLGLLSSDDSKQFEHTSATTADTGGRAALTDEKTLPVFVESGNPPLEVSDASSTVSLPLGAGNVVPTAGTTSPNSGAAVQSENGPVVPIVCPSILLLTTSTNQGELAGGYLREEILQERNGWWQEAV
jgi:hypothetical protein